MKNAALFLLALSSAIVLTSCKNDLKNTDSTTDLAVVDTLITETVPDHLYVTAVSGLSLREHNNLQSEKLAVMPLGTKVKIINTVKESTMNIGGISGAMDKVEFNNKVGFAFNGFLSKFFPPEPDVTAKSYAEDLKKEFPSVSYSEATGGTASKPTNSEILILPTSRWHEAFFTAQQLFKIPKEFAFPNPKGSNQETQKSGTAKKTVLTSELQISRNNNVLQKIEYNYRTKNFGYTVTITQNGENMKLERKEIVE